MATETFAQEVVSSQRLQIVNYMMVASLTILVYDYFLTFTTEVKYIWNTRLNVIKALYFLSRYPAFFDISLSLYLAVKPHFNIRLCGPISCVSTWSMLLGVTFAELILVIRTTAIWGRSKRVLYGLLSLVASIFVSGAVITNIYQQSIIPTAPPFPAIYGCNLSGGNPIVFFDFVLLMLLESVNVGLMTYRVYKEFRNSANPTLVTLHRDGVLFFIYLFVIGLVNILILVLCPIEFQNLIIPFQRCMHSVLSCRIILHVRESNDTEGMSLRTPNIEISQRLGGATNITAVSEDGETTIARPYMNPVERAVEMMSYIEGHDC